MKRKMNRKVRIALNLLLIPVLAAVCYVLDGCPPLTPEMAFRRAEQAHLVGPGEILGTEEIGYDCYDRLIIADAGDGVILYLYGTQSDRTCLGYREKEASSTLMTAPDTPGYLGRANEVQLPIVLFDHAPRAGRAEIEFTLTANYNGENFEKTYLLEADRTNPGYFLFTLDARAESAWGLEAEGAALHTFVLISANLEKFPETTIPATVRYYDSSGALLSEELIRVHTEAAIAHNE